MIDIKLVKERYESLPDEDITRIARTNAQGLVDGAIPLLIAEIEKRKLGKDLVEWIAAERRQLSAEELFKLKEIVVNSPCQDCESTEGLRGFEYGTRKSLLRGSELEEHRVVVCGICGRSRKMTSFVNTLVLGWWSGMGLILTPFTLLGKLFSVVRSDKFGEKIVERFIQENMGKITLSNDDPNIVRNLLRSWNRKNDPIKPRREFF